MDDQKCVDFVRGLALSPDGVAVKVALCPDKPATEESPPMDLVIKAVNSNISRVWHVTNQLGKGGSVTVKQLLPTHKTLSVSQPLSRGGVEVASAALHAEICGGKVARLLHADVNTGIFVYERIEPHVVVRMELLAGNMYPLLAEDASAYLSRKLYKSNTTWCPSLGAAATAARTALESQSDEAARRLLAATMLELPFGLEPSRPIAGIPSAAPLSAPTAAWVQLLRADAKVTAAVDALRSTLETSRDAICHGDLHTGRLLSAILKQGQPARISIETLRPEDFLTSDELDALMSQQTAVGDLRVIGGGGDTALLGPAGLDVGVLSAHLLLALASCRARVRQQEAVMARGGYAKYAATKARDRWAEHCAAIAEVIDQVWAQTVVRMCDAWDADRGWPAPPAASASPAAAAAAAGCHDHGCACDDSDTSTAAASPSASSPYWKDQVTALTPVLADAYLFCGAEIVRRIAGPAPLRAPELDGGIDSPVARVGAECRMLALAHYLLANGRSIAASVSKRALACGDRTSALRVFTSGFEPLVSAAAAIDGQPGWTKDIDSLKALPSAAAAAAEVDAGQAIPGRTVTATVVTVNGGSSAATAAPMPLPAGFAHVVITSTADVAAASKQLQAAIRACFGPVVLVGASAAGKGGVEGSDGSGAAGADVTTCITSASAEACGGAAAAAGSHVLALPPHAVLLLLAAADPTAGSTAGGAGDDAAAGTSASPLAVVLAHIAEGRLDAAVEEVQAACGV